MRKYYVYEHREADTGRVFYIGKGFGDRLIRTSKRNKYWMRVYKKHGFTAHKIYEDLTEADALSLEISIISSYGRENLTNMTDGGEGVSSLASESRMKQAIGKASTQIFKFYHDIHGVFTGTSFELSKRFNMKKSEMINIRAMCNGRNYKHISGWRITEEKIPSRRNIGEIDGLFFTLFHEDYGLAITTREGAVDLHGMNKSNFKSLLYGACKKSAGWTLENG